MEQKVLKVIYGLSADTNHETKKLLTDIATTRGYQVTFIHRYRKEGVLQYAEEHPEFHTILLQEILQQSSPYTAEDLSLLTDNRHNVNVVVSLDWKHYGTRYMHLLYAAGIHNAIFDKDSYAEQIVELLIKKRTKKEARSYYGIPSIAELEQEFHILSEEKKQSYIQYLSEGSNLEEILSRYEFLTKQLSTIQNVYLIQALPEQIKLQLQNHSCYESYGNYRKQKKNTKRWFEKKSKGEKKSVSKRKSQQNISLPQMEAKKSRNPVLVSADNGTIRLSYEP